MPEDEIRAKHLKFIPITYDHILSAFHDRWEDLCGEDAVATGVAAIDPRMGEVFEELSKSVDEIDGWRKFFWTHLLDAFLWYLFEDARMAVVSHVCKELIRGLNDLLNEDAEDRGYAHVLAHSLGTTVTHDSLVALRHWNRDEGLFKPDKHIWETVGMIANVGRLLETNFTLKQGVDVSEFKVYESALKPGVDGTICRNYLNARHTVDPFTWPRQFAPSDWSHSAYSDIETKRIREVTEVHDFANYLADPGVHIRLLRLLLMQRVGFCSKPERAAAEVKYRDEFPVGTSTAFQDLRAIYGDDPDSELTLGTMATFLFKALKGVSQ